MTKAFNRGPEEEVLRRYHSITSNLKDTDPQLRMLYQWMFVPPTLWPINIQDVLSNFLLPDTKRLLGISQVPQMLV